MNEDIVILPDLQIIKVNAADASEMLDGAVFTLTAADGEVRTETTVNGAASFTGVSEGVYALEEAKSPDGFADNGTVYNVEVTLAEDYPTEELIDGKFQRTYVYKLSVTGGKFDGDVLTVENTRDEGSITITKAFGEGNVYIPDSVELSVAGPDNYEETVILKKEEGFITTITGLPLGTYTITEDEEKAQAVGYELEITGNGAQVAIDSVNHTGSAVITNTYVIETVTFSAAKEWDDNDNQDGIRPEAVTIYVKKGETTVDTLVLNAENGWKATSKELPRFDNGVEIAFIVNGEAADTAPDGRGGMNYVFNVTIGDAETVEYRIKAGHTLTIAGVPYGAAYKVEEVILKGALFTGKISENAEGIIGTEKISVKAVYTYRYSIVNPGLNLIKVDSETGAPIAGAEFTLYADAACTRPVASAVSDKNGRLNLDIDVPLTEIAVFYLKETGEPEGYHANGDIYSFRAEWDMIAIGQGSNRAIRYELVIVNEELSVRNGAYVIENTAIKDVDLSVRKIWNDGGYVAGRPESIEVVLIMDGEAVETVVLSEDNGWYYAWETLTDEHDWTIQEIEVHVDFTPDYVRNGNAWIITNPRELIDIEGEKVWNLNGHDVLLPESVTINLYANGDKVDEITIGAETGWKWKFENLPVTQNGTEIVYTVSEDAVADYTTAITGDVETGFTVTNTYKTVDIEGEKVWNLNGYENAPIPESVTIRLYANGVEVASTTASEATSWMWSFTNMPVSIDGEEIVYTI